jgi:uncharacterized membrane protein
MIAFLESTWLFSFFLQDRIRTIRKEVSIHGKGIFLMSAVFALAFFCLLKAYQAGGEASKVLPVFSLSLVFASVAGIFFLHERNAMMRKFVALVLVMIGTYILQAL